MRRGLRGVILGLVALFAATVNAEPYFSGHSGLIQMPDGRVAPEGTLGFGVAYSRPYVGAWSAVGMLPWIEGTVRFTRVMGTPGFVSNTSYGDYKDKSLGVKIRLLEETPNRPSVSLGLDDFISDTPRGLFRTNYLAATKQIGELDLTLGIGNKHIDGIFAGARYRPKSLPAWGFVAEYDATDYPNSFRAREVGTADRKKSPNLGIEYHWGWLGVQLSIQQDHVGLNTYAQIPLQQRDWIPKIQEPQPFSAAIRRPTSEEWRNDPSVRRRLAEALHQQDFRNARVGYDNYELHASLTNIRISQVSRAVGRAARVLLLLGPSDARQIKITYSVRDLPAITYTFFDLDKLARYFNGQIARWEFAEYVDIDYPRPGEVAALRDKSEALDGFLASAEGLRLVLADDGDPVAVKSEDSLLNSFNARLGLSTFLNDPAKPFQYDLFAIGSWNKRLGQATHAQVVARLTLSENLSDAILPSNSQLPHVRTDVADYKRGGRFKIDRALVNHFFQPRERVYGRVSAGIYEEMFGGVGGQVLYFPRGANWAIDVNADWVRQRDFRGLLGFRDYATVTALASLNYKLPLQLTGTARAGRFLAKDNGVRFEVKRTFISGVEVGAWYTLTDGKDTTSPGSPGNPYKDKGVFLSLPLNLLLTKDTQATAGFALAPWTRDVGQMVGSPGDLYRIMEKPLLRDAHAWDGLVRFGDRDDDYALPGDRNRGLLDRDLLWELGQDARNGGDLISSPRTWRAIGMGAGLTLLSSLADRRTDKWVQNTGSSQRWHQIDNAGKAVPLVGFGLAGLAALQNHDERLATTGLSSLQAGILGAAISTGLKQLIGRARPVSGSGPAEFGIKDRAESSFPSNHATTAWALVTPFAREYDAPWLYGTALLTSLGRVGTRQHWLSDTVASALIGYGLGSVIWSWHRDPKREELRLSVSPDGVAVSRQF